MGTGVLWGLFHKYIIGMKGAGRGGAAAYEFSCNGFHPEPDGDAYEFSCNGFHPEPAGEFRKERNGGGKSCNFPQSLLTRHTHFMLTQHMGGYQQDAGYLIPFFCRTQLACVIATWRGLSF